MIRMFSVALLVATAQPCLSNFASAASDITMASIATGRLYVVGTTEHPRTEVMLDGRFHTQSNDDGNFQYELVYHPATCIVAAVIEGVTHDAVVGNCGQQVMPGTWLEPHAAVDAPGLLKRLMTAPPESQSASFRPAERLEEPQNSVPALPTIPALPVFTTMAWLYLFVQSEPPPAGSDETATAVAPTALEAASFVPATGGNPPHLPAASQVSLAKFPTTFARRQVRRLGFQPASFQPATPVGIWSAGD